HFGPEPGELTVLEGQHLVPWRERVDQRRLPRAGSRSRKDHDRPGRPEDLLQAIEHLVAEQGKIGAPMVDRRLRHRAQDPIRDVRGTRDLEEVPAASVHENGHMVAEILTSFVFAGFVFSWPSSYNRHSSWPPLSPSMSKAFGAHSSLASRARCASTRCHARSTRPTPASIKSNRSASS